ncbi:MAG: hypothetical protein Hals2KO_40630 [Halioglobus sp.]
MPADSFRPFLIYVFALLLPCFGLWFATSSFLALPVIAVVHEILVAWFPQVVHAVYADNTSVFLATAYGQKAGMLVPLAEAEYRFGFSIDTRILSYSLPFYSALLFATRREDYLVSWLQGVIVLYLLFAIGLLAICLKNLMTTVPEQFFGQAEVTVPGANLIAIGYQVNVLLVPTLAPVMLWLWQSRETTLLRDLLPPPGREKSQAKG